MIPTNHSNPDYDSPDTSPKAKPLKDWIVNVDDIPLANLDKEKLPYSIHDDTTDDDTDADEPNPLKRDNENFEEARRIFRTLTSGHSLSRFQEHSR